MSATTDDIWLKPITEVQSSRQWQPELMELWTELQACSADIIASTPRDPMSFVDDHCFYAATIQSFHPKQQGINMFEEHSSPITVDDELDGLWDREGVEGWLENHRSPGQDGINPTEPFPLGFIYLTPAAFPGSLNLGVIVSPNYRRQGYATQAIRLVLNFAFHELNCHRVEVRIADNNKRHRSSTVRLFASIGFEREAYSRCALFVRSPHANTNDSQEPSGEWRDVITMSMLDTSWAYFSRAPVLSIVEIRRRWDDMFSRHDSERDELLALEEHVDRQRQQLRMANHKPLKAYFSYSNDPSLSRAASHAPVSESSRPSSPRSFHSLLPYRGVVISSRPGSAAPSVASGSTMNSRASTPPASGASEAVSEAESWANINNISSGASAVSDSSDDSWTRSNWSTVDADASSPGAS